MVERHKVVPRAVGFARQIGEGGEALAEGRGIDERLARGLALLQLLQAALGVHRLFLFGEKCAFQRRCALSSPLRRR